MTNLRKKKTASAHSSETSSSTPKTLPKEKVVELYRKALLAGIPFETVHQKLGVFLERVSITESVEFQQDYQQEVKRRAAVPLKKKIFFTVVPVVCVLVGLFLVGNAAVPILSYYVFTAPELNKMALLAPIPQDQVLDVMPKIIVQAKTNSGDEANVLGDSTEATNSTNTNGVSGGSTSSASSGTGQQPTNPPPTIVDTELDYTNLSNWFPNLTLPQVDENSIQEYTLDVPDVGIQNAKVRMGGSNLDKSLIQYPGTASPGQNGAPVVFGHSTLEQFYNPKEENPRRYLSIFSKILNLKNGNKIYVTYQNVKYTYVVRSKHVVNPDDTSILEQRYDSKELKLVTCTPDGTTQFRGIIEAQLVNEGE